MRFSLSSLALVPALLSAFAQAAPSPEPEPLGHGYQGRRPAPVPDNRHRQASCNTASNRACWTSGFDIHTDYEVKTPNTGVTRTYTLEVTEHDNYVGPDGDILPSAMLINGKFPGPTITANWGDYLSITVINSLKYNGTSMHWHGIRQLNTNMQDGANGITECPIPPGGSLTYKFRATQYGTTWYHSHFSAQYGNGVWGTIVINGPASLPYDIDLGVFPISDYYNRSAEELVLYTQDAGSPPSDNVMFNGTNINPYTGVGAYANVTLTPGKRHRLRIINPSVENHFVLSLANHTFTIIAADLVPVNSQTVDSLFIAPGQRYDVTIDASQSVGNYWFNVTYPASGTCGASYNPYPAAVFRYKGAPSILPTYPGTAPTQADCYDPLNLTPVVSRTIDISGFTVTENNEVNITLDVNAETPIFTWRVNGSIANINWNKPVNEYIMEGNTSYPAGNNIVSVDVRNQWTFWLIENDPTIGLPHPIHLHGHDFVTLGRNDESNPAPFTASDVSSLSGQNPVRRDVVMLPSKGWIVIGFKTDNPGSWLMHCHIAWHVSGGLAMNFLERTADFKSSISAADKTAFNNNCAAWRAYFPDDDPYPQIDSGI